MSSNGKFAFRRATHTAPSTAARWDLIDRGRGAVLYSIDGEFGDDTALISDDGKSVVILDDWGSQEWRLDRKVAWFFSLGGLLNAYDFETLGIPRESLSMSASHMSWFMNPPARIVDGRLKLTTFDLRLLTFEVSTGRLLGKEFLSTLRPGDVVLLGEVALEMPGLPGRIPRRYRIRKPQCVIFGSFPCEGEATFGMSASGAVTSFGRHLESLVLPNETSHGMVHLRNGRLVDAWDRGPNTCRCP